VTAEASRPTDEHQPPEASRSLTADERRAALAEIAAEVSVCRRCPLSVGRTHAVPGEGHPDTEVVFVGEGPGFNEDQQGRPFVGAAGSLLNELLKAIGWRRDEVFITNIVKCRPPANRDPEPNEIAACAPYLQRQLAVLDPALVVTLGRHSLQTFRPGTRIGQVHGTQQPVEPAAGASGTMTFSMYHPAAALRQNSLRETMLADMARLPQALLGSRQRRAGSAPEIDQPVAAPPDGSAGSPLPPAESAPDQPAPVAVAPGPPDPENQMELFLNR
jgi:DNA polymerase